MADAARSPLPFGEAVEAPPVPYSEASKATPVRAPGRSDLLFPLGQAAISAVVIGGPLGGTAGLILYGITTVFGFEPRFALISYTTVIVSGLTMTTIWSLWLGRYLGFGKWPNPLMIIERITGLDIDGDGQVGNDPKDIEIKAEVTYRDEKGKIRKMQYADVSPVI